VRVALTLSAVALGLAAMIGQAAAQYYPAPSQYGGYRPAPDTDEDVRPPAGVPGRAEALPPGYSYGAPQPYDPRYDNDDDTTSAMPAQPQQRYGSAPAYDPPPGYNNSPNSANAAGPASRPLDLNNQNSSSVATLPPEDQPETGEAKELPPNLKRQLVDYQTAEPAGTIVIDTPHTYLYLVLGNGKALRYGIGVGREGFTWAGRERITRMAEWPDWIPPKEMIERQPYLPRFMAGGDSNPLGARALYLGNTVYRIHGTNQPSTIGSFVSSGCIRLTNTDIEDLYRRVQVGTRVVVMPGSAPPADSVSAANSVH
jgi:lipoprotein-anchoring transpeptidase ErfK/SrfK